VKVARHITLKLSNSSSAARYCGSIIQGLGKVCLRTPDTGAPLIQMRYSRPRFAALGLMQTQLLPQTPLADRSISALSSTVKLIVSCELLSKQDVEWSMLDDMEAMAAGFLRARKFDYLAARNQRLPLVFCFLYYPVPNKFEFEAPHYSFGHPVAIKVGTVLCVGFAPLHCGTRKKLHVLPKWSRWTNGFRLCLVRRLRSQTRKTADANGRTAIGSASV
jgi:hypothetical protein